MATTVSTGDWHFVVNLLASTLGEVPEAMSSVLAAAGWTIIQSSDASTITPSARLSAADWLNTNAWEHWEDPSGNRELTLHKGSSAAFRVRMAPNGTTLSGATPSAPPTNADIQDLVGTGSSFDTGWIDSSPGTEYWQMGAKDTADGDFFPFYFCSYAISTGVERSCCIVDAVESWAASGDSELWACVDSDSLGSGIVRFWYDYGGGSQQWLSSADAVTIWSISQVTATQNPYDSEYHLNKVALAETSPTHVKDWLQNVRAKGASGHVVGDTYNSADANPYWIFGDYAIPYHQSTAPAL